MKQTLKYTIVFLAGALFATAGSAYGAEAIKTISAKLRPDIKVSVNGKQLDAAAISYNNTTYLPLRKAAEAINGKIELYGTHINIVTETNPAEPGSSAGNGNSTGSKGSTGSATEIPNNGQVEETYPIEGKVLINSIELYINLDISEQGSFQSRVLGLQDKRVSFGEKSETAYQNIDYYYDLSSNQQYYTEDFLLKIIPSSKLNGLKRYSVNVSKNIVNPI